MAGTQLSSHDLCYLCCEQGANSTKHCMEQWLNSQLEPKTRQYAELSRFLVEEPKLIDVTWQMPSVMGICSDL